MRPLSESTFASPYALPERGASSHRLVGITAAILVQVAFGYALVSGFAHQLPIDIPHRLMLTYVQPKIDVPPEPTPQTPTAIPEPRDTIFVPPVLDIPTANLPLEDGSGLTPTRTETGTGNIRPAVPDHGPVVIAATHTKPPYPPVSRRLGEEGMVRLTITVAADGSVAQAAVAASSGHARLDQAAVDWVKANWRYQPGISGGNPAISTISAMVNFELQ